MSSSTTKITDIHPEIIQSHILTRIDGPSLAATAATSPQLRRLCSNEKVWADLCNSTWTSTKHPLLRDIISSFPGGHRSFFSDSFPTLQPSRQKILRRSSSTAEIIISAVDINFENKLVYSKVHLTKTGSGNFLDSNFGVDLLGPKETVLLNATFDREDDKYLSDLKEKLTLSWIMVDPILKRAANVSSVQPVSARPHWIGGHVEVKYGILVKMSKIIELRITAMLEWKGVELELKRVNLKMYDIDNKCLSGKESLRVLVEAMENGKKKKGKKGEERERYRKYVEMKRKRREGNQWRISPAAVATIFLAFICLILWVFL